MKRIFLYTFFLFILPMQVFAEKEEVPRLSPVLSSGPVDAGSIFQVMAALLLIIFMIVGVSWLYKKYGFSCPGSNHNIKVVTALSLGGKEKVVLLQIGEEQLLLGVSPGCIRKLHDISNPIVNVKPESSSSFISNLNNEIKKVINK